jgi:hypothetical protein
MNNGLAEMFRYNAWAGIAPTGKTIAVMGISIGRHDANGQLVESWTTWDRLTMLQQLDINLVPERTREVGG